LEEEEGFLFKRRQGVKLGTNEKENEIEKFIIIVVLEGTR